eukprot:4330338-Amphidinium_carterae.4
MICEVRQTCIQSVRAGQHYVDPPVSASSLKPLDFIVKQNNVKPSAATSIATLGGNWHVC